MSELVLEWQRAIRSDPVRNPSVMRAMAASLRTLVKERQGSVHFSPIMLERNCMTILCDAIRAGAFSGPEWHLFRRLLADQPHILSAVHFLKHGPPHGVTPEALRQPNARGEVAAEMLATIIDNQAQTMEQSQVGLIEADIPIVRAAKAAAPLADRRKGIRQPSDIAIAAYRLDIATGRTQAEIASTLEQEFRQPVKQNQISRWLRQVQRFVEAGNILPTMAKPPPPAKSINPSRLDIGRRTIATTKRQRNQQSDD